MKKFANALAVRHKVGLSSFFMLCIISKPHSPYHHILQTMALADCFAKSNPLKADIKLITK